MGSLGTSGLTPQIPHLGNLDLFMSHYISIFHGTFQLELAVSPGELGCLLITKQRQRLAEWCVSLFLRGTRDWCCNRDSVDSNQI